MYKTCDPNDVEKNMWVETGDLMLVLESSRKSMLCTFFKVRVEDTEGYVYGLDDDCVGKLVV
jgi:hypothetical protein